MRDRDLAPAEAALHILWSPGKNEKIIVERLRLGGSSGEPKLLLAADLTNISATSGYSRLFPSRVLPGVGMRPFEQVHHFASSTSSIRLVCF